MLDSALYQIYTRVFRLWKSIDLDNAWVKDSRPFISFFIRVLSRISLESLGLASIAQVPGNRPKVGQNVAARRPVSATFQSLSVYISARLLITERAKIFPLSISLKTKVLSN